MNLNQLQSSINEKLSRFQIYLETMPKDELYSYMAVFVGIVLIVLAFILGS